MEVILIDNLIENRFMEEVKNNHLFDGHSKILIALSGGIDSQTLFNLLYKFRKELNLEIGVAHVNHKVRAESDDEENILRHRMSEIDVPFYCDCFTGEFTESKARDFRYNFFQKVMEENNYTCLVTAHHADDVVETVFMRQLRGSRLRYLTGIKQKQNFANGELIRPLLNFKKSDFDTKDYFDDYTNYENEYLRNRIRNQYIPELEKENPAFKKSILSLSKEVDAAMDVINTSIKNLNFEKDKIDLEKFLNQDQSLQYFILQDYLDNYKDISIGRDQFDQLLHIIRKSGQFNQRINKNYSLIKDDKNFYLASDSLPESKIEYEVSRTKPQNLDYKEIYIPKDANFFVRGREEGDRILLNGINKKVKRYFIDQKIPLKMRENAQMLVVEGQIYEILGIATSDLSKSLKNAKMNDTLYYFER